MNHNIGIPLATRNYFSIEECQRIIDMSAELEEMEGVAGYQAQTGILRKSRIKSIVPTETNRWLYQKLQAAALSANQHYQFDIKGFSEGLQVAEYSGGGHFDWHLDIGTSINAERKLSISVQLSDDADYEGGDFEFLALENQQIPRGRGDIIIFPAFLVHRVTPVTAGTRWSLVAWVHGPAFR